MPDDMKERRAERLLTSMLGLPESIAAETVAKLDQSDVDLIIDGSEHGPLALQQTLDDISNRVNRNNTDEGTE